MSSQAKPSIVFAHGLRADGSCYSKVIPALQADEHQVISAQNSLDTLEGDVAAVTRALGRVPGPVILVGHSYGGTVITAAGADDRVAGLVYISALAPDEDETSQSLQDKFPVTDVFQHIEVSDGRIWLLPSGIECLAGDLPEDEQWLAYDTVASVGKPRTGDRSGVSNLPNAPSSESTAGRRPYPIAGWHVISISDRGGTVMTPERMTRSPCASPSRPRRRTVIQSPVSINVVSTPPVSDPCPTAVHT